MTTTFATVTLPNASKIGGGFQTLTGETVLLSGKRAVQSSTEYGRAHTFTCYGTWAQFEALLAKVGTKGDLVTEADTFSNCYISGELALSESNNPGSYYWKISFVQDTT